MKYKVYNSILRCFFFFQIIKSQQEQIDFLRKENAGLGEELHKLKCEAASPPEDKDAELKKLRKDVAQLQRSKETQVCSPQIFIDIELLISVDYSDLAT